MLTLSSPGCGWVQGVRHTVRSSGGVALAPKDRAPETAAVRRRLYDLRGVADDNPGEPSYLDGQFRAMVREDERLAEVDRRDSRLVIARHEPHHTLAQEALDLLQVEVDLFAPTIDDDANLLARVAEPVEEFERALGAANCRDV